MPPFSIGDRAFSTKSEAQVELRRVLNSVQLGDAVSGEDGRLVADLLYDGRHPEALEKIGVGIDHIEVRPASHGTRCFWVVHTDGTAVDFSIKAAVNGRPSTKAGVIAALREEIRDEIGMFRQSHPEQVQCVICGFTVSREEAFVTYIDPTFDEIATNFVMDRGGWDAVREEPTGPYGRQLSNLNTAAEWHEQHRAQSKLSLAHPKCNLTRSRSR